MKYQVITAALTALASATEVFDAKIDTEDYYNILTIDGGGIRGLIPAMVLSEMEAYAYTYSQDTKNNLGKYAYMVPQYPGHESRIALKDLFNMTAGTSTGSILAAGLSYPNATYENLSAADKAKEGIVKLNGTVYTHPGFFAEGLINIYANMGDQIFVPNTLGFGWDFLWFLVFIGAFGVVGWFLGIYLYDNPEDEKAFKALRNVISNNKSIKKQQTPKHYEGKNDPQRIKNAIEQELKERLLPKDQKEQTLDQQQQARLMKKIPSLNKGKLSVASIKNNNDSGKVNEINTMIADAIQANVQDAQVNLSEAEKKYHAQKPNRWVVFAVFILLGLFLGIEIPQVTNMLSASKYSRKSLDNIMQKLLGAFYFPDVLTQELLVVSYEYNSQEPRFYSKYFTHQDPAIYNVTIGKSTGSSSAAPTFFNPHEVTNGYGYKELQIDGGVICNNPALYAYEMARDLYGYRKIRVLSLGTGQLPFTPVKADDFNIFTAIKMKGEFMMNMDAYSADYWLKQEICDEKGDFFVGSCNNYHRAQMVSSLSMDDVSPTAVANLQKAGGQLWEENKVQIQAILKTIVDERFGPNNRWSKPATSQ